VETYLQWSAIEKPTRLPRDHPWRRMLILDFFGQDYVGMMTLEREEAVKDCVLGNQM
jgi:hypothetical protein